MAWPPTLADLKEEMKVPDNVTEDDVNLTRDLEAAIAFVVRVRTDLDFGTYPLPDAKVPDADTVLGTLRLAVRWNTRRRSPEALIDAGEMGSARVPSFDPDIDRLLCIGKYRGPVVA
ncbi:hypothetical protein ACWEF6_01910 [Amycolatopsis sp. NPDC004772]